MFSSFRILTVFWEKPHLGTSGLPYKPDASELPFANPRQLGTHLHEEHDWRLVHDRSTAGKHFLFRLFLFLLVVVAVGHVNVRVPVRRRCNGTWTVHSKTALT